MKIVHLISTFPPYAGGMGNVCLAQVKELTQLGHQVVVLVPGKKNKIVSRDGFKIKYIPFWFKYGNAAFVPGLVKDLKNFDLIHLHWPFFGGAEILLLWFSLQLKKKKLIVQYHMDPLAPGVRGLIFKLNSFLFLPLMVKKADQILVSSQDYLVHSKLNKFEQKNKKKFKISPFGVNQKRFFPQEKKESLLKKHNLNLKDKIVLSVGGLDRAHYFKGIKLLIRAMEIVKKSTSEIKLLIVGDGDLRPEYEKLTNQLGLKKSVIFAKRIEDEILPDYYNLADIFALPSFTRSEAFGLVTLEAMACAKPVLVSNLPGPRSLVEKNGLIVKINDPLDLAEKILIAFKDSETLSQWGKQSYHLTQTKYFWPHIVKNLVKIYVE
jgi:glycosyltransferase involved in cell wall biosynthesis